MRPKGRIIGCLGLLLMAAGIMGVGRHGNIWNDLIIGVIVALLGFAQARLAPRGLVSGIVGLWLIISSFIPGLRVGAGARWNNVTAGVILAIAGFATPRTVTKSTLDNRKAA
jgi:hypothetical protein